MLLRRTLRRMRPLKARRRGWLTRTQTCETSAGSERADVFGLGACFVDACVHLVFACCERESELAAGFFTRERSF